MALSYGFYNSVDGDRKYDAIQFGSIFDGIIKDGVYGTYLKGMIVIASSNAGEVIIQPGRAWFNHTWSYNDANLPFEAPAPEVLLDRIDALVLEINEELAYRQNSFKWVKGEPASQNPQRPTLTNTTTVHQYPLCYVHRYPETTTIQTKDITNAIGTSETPFATGVLEGIDLDAWINQWDDEFHTWENATKSDFTQWRTTEQNEWTAWRTQEQTSFEAWMLTQQTVYDAWFTALKTQMDTDVADVEAWVETIKDIIDSQTASHLQAEIDELQTWTPNGSYFDITTQEPELFSRAVTVSDLAGHTQSVNFDSSGHAVIKSYPYIGNLTITSTDGIRTATYPISVPYFGRFDIELSFWRATVQIEGSEELESGTVTVKNSDDVTVAVVTLNASAEGTFNATYPDTYKFIAYYEGETTEEEVEVLEETTYTVELAFWRAFVNLFTTDTEVYGTLIDIKDSNDITIGSVQLSSSTGEAIWKAKKPDTYTFNYTYGGEDMSISLAVTQETTYSVEIYGGFSWTHWVTLGGLDHDDYNDLADVFNDEAAVRRLMLVHASADYLAEMTAKKQSEIDVFSVNDTAMKWIGQSDYICDKLLAIDSNAVITDATSNTINGITFTVNSDGSVFVTGIASADAEFTLNATSNATTIRGVSTLTGCPEGGGNDSYFLKFTTSTSVESIDTGDGALVSGSVTGNTSIVVKSGQNVNLVFKPCIRENDSTAISFFKHKYVEEKLLSSSSWERILKDHVPTMTSDTSPYGAVIKSGEQSAYPAWHVFNTSQTGQYGAWIATTQGGNPTSWVGYRFGEPICVKKFMVKAGDPTTIRYDAFTIQASNDYVNWTDLTPTLATTDQQQTFTINNDNYYTYYRFYLTSSSGYSGGGRPNMDLLQFYGRSLKASIPVMTSNTTPYGEALGLNYDNNYLAWKSFDNVNTTYYLTPNSGTGDNNRYVGYTFEKPFRPKYFIAKFNDSYTRTFVIQYSDDGTTWTDANDITYSNNNTYVTCWLIENMEAHKSWRLYEKSASTTSRMKINKLDFYDSDYSEKEFESGSTKKWLYDHGVELVTLDSLTGSTSGASVTKEDSQIVCKPSTSTAAFTNYAFVFVHDEIDFSLYSKIKCNAGDQIVGTTTSGYVGNSGGIAIRSVVPSGTYSDNDVLASKDIKVPVAASKTIILDISSVNSTDYACLGTGYWKDGYSSYTEWWLE